MENEPGSIYHMSLRDMYCLKPTDIKKLPFNLLAGEMVVHYGSQRDGIILITNYRLYLQNGENQYHIPLGLIEIVEVKELFHLHIGCKDARSYRCTFENNEKCAQWSERILKSAEPPKALVMLFSFYYWVWMGENGGNELTFRIENQRKYSFNKQMFEDEMTRLQFKGDSWRISKANEDYKLCPTYPPYLLVPSCINDEMLESVAKFRSSRRIPAAVWRHTRNGAVIARCSQPEVGWLGWRSGEDEDLIKAISDACNFDRNLRHINSDRDSNLSHSPGSFHSDESLQITTEITPAAKKVLIMDARSYTTAVANRARGGGCECPEYYPNCEIQFMNLANIHSIRKSFHSLRLLCSSSAEQPNWFSGLERTMWLFNMSTLMKAALTLVTAVERDARPVLVHCSDGWDRTPQIVSLAELMLDPFYRTIDGFRTLIEREWLAFGHKFADRCGHSTGSDDQNERCPVFLQWLDCVHQLLNQFPCAFEFSQTYLVKLVQHTYSNLFGTFLCNTQQERSSIVAGKTFSVWEFLSSPCFRNHLYAPATSSCGHKVLWPQCNIRDLQLWSEVYLGSMEASFTCEGGSGSCPGPPDASPLHMTKTRSYGDLINAGDAAANRCRRSSDPSITVDTNLILTNDIPQAPAATSDETTHNGHLSNGPDFLPSDLEDADCNQDCIFKDQPADSLMDDQIDGLEVAFNEDDAPANDNVTSNGLDLLGAEDGQVIHVKTDGLDSLSLRDDDVKNGDVNRNGGEDGEVTTVNGDSGGKGTKGSDECGNGVGTSSRAIVGTFLDFERSVETSTETLVSENVVSGSSPKEINGFEKIQSPTNEMTDGCRACARGLQNGDINCSSPYHSSISNGWENLQNLLQHRNFHPYRPLGEDGLVPLSCALHERLDQIFEEQKRKVDLLEKELHITRQKLIMQSCHRCNHTDSDRHDDSSSVAESSCSASEGHASAGESLRSELSWVAVEQGSLGECQGTLWVPDHAVSRCTGCGTEFWMGRRRHHCRKCGKIFCADCSENSTPLPSEQLYNPVRVCTACYSELHGEIANQYNRSNNNLPPNGKPQIAASSN